MSTLTDYLKANGISQRAFAQRIGVDPGTVSRLVAGKMTPSLPLAVKIECETHGKVRAVNLVVQDRAAG